MTYKNLSDLSNEEINELISKLYCIKNGRAYELLDKIGNLLKELDDLGYAIIINGKRFDHPDCIDIEEQL